MELCNIPPVVRMISEKDILMTEHRIVHETLSNCGMANDEIINYLAGVSDTTCELLDRLKPEKKEEH